MTDARTVKHCTVVMLPQFAIIVFVQVMAGCITPYRVPFDLTDVANDKTYGYSQHNPVKVGGVAVGQKARHRETFLMSLRGPQGQPISYVSQGTCCVFDNDPSGKSRGDIEVLLITYPGIPKPVLLYLDYYRFETPKSPMGFGFASAPSAVTSH